VSFWRPTKRPAISTGSHGTRISPLCGLIRVLERIPKDLTEPESPIIVSADLANSQFLQGG
jgi:hypothetical protein